MLSNWHARARLVAVTLIATGLVATAATPDERDPAPPISITSGAFKTPLVELYTSEGCSSCPPADRWLRQLGQALTQDFAAVPLAFHVDYWNYLGWVDAYSKPAFTARQRRIAANNRQAGIYTPEFFVNGRETRGGENIVQSIEKANSQLAAATLQVQVTRRDSTGIAARLAVDNRAPPAHAYVAIYENDITRTINAGENRGKTLQHDFVVRYWREVLQVNRGAHQAEVQIDLPAAWQRRNLGVAVILLERASGATVQAVRASLAPLFSAPG